MNESYARGFAQKCALAGRLLPAAYKAAPAPALNWLGRLAARTTAFSRKYNFTRPVAKAVRGAYRWTEPLTDPSTEMTIKLMDRAKQNATRSVEAGLPPGMGLNVPELLSDADKAMMRQQGVKNLRELRKTVLYAGVLPPAVGIGASFAASPAWDATKALGRWGKDKLGSNELSATAYSQGFLQKCAEAGVDPGMLSKWAQGSPMNQMGANLMSAGLTGGVPGALMSGPGHRTAGAAAGTLASGLTQEAGRVGIEAILPKLRALAKVHPELANNLLNILSLTKDLGSVAAGAGVGRAIGRMAPEGMEA